MQIPSKRNSLIKSNSLIKGIPTYNRHTTDSLTGGRRAPLRRAEAAPHGCQGPREEASIHIKETTIH